MSGCEREQHAAVVGEWEGEVGGAMMLPGQVYGRLPSLDGLRLVGTAVGEQSAFYGYPAHPRV